MPKLCSLPPSFNVRIKIISFPFSFTLEMSNYKERSLPLFITTASMFLGYSLLEGILVFSFLLRDIIIGAIIIVFASSIISKYWKISLHMLAFGGLVGVLFSLHFLYGKMINILIVSVLISGILGVSRIKEQAHNNIQVYTGFIIGFFVEVYFILLF